MNVVVFALLMTITAISSSFLSTSLDNTDFLFLHKASSNKLVRNGIIQVDRIFYIQTSILSSEREVFVHHQMLDGSWEDIPTIAFDKFESDGVLYEMWKAEVHWLSIGCNYDFGDQFVIKLTTKSSTVWDNHDWRNYYLPQNSGSIFGKRLHVNLNSASLIRFSYDQKTRLHGTVYVKNIAYHKKVFVLYTTNKSRKLRRVDCSYSETFTVPFSVEVRSPNMNGVEQWNFSDDLDTEKVEYAELIVGYETNGKTYYDSDFSRKYKLQVIIS